MSLWIESPEIIERATGATRLRFKDALWSLDQASWLSEHQIELTLRKYPGNRIPCDFQVLVDCERDIAVLPDGTPVPLDKLEAILEAELLRRPLVKQSRLPG